jgi:hypothetical protein
MIWYKHNPCIWLLPHNTKCYTVKKSTVVKINSLVRHRSWSWRKVAVSHFQAKQCQAVGKFYSQEYYVIYMHISAIWSYLSLCCDAWYDKISIQTSSFITHKTAISWVIKRLIFNICHIWYITEHNIQNYNHKPVIVIRHYAFLFKWKPIYGMQNVKSTIPQNNFL